MSDDECRCGLDMGSGCMCVLQVKEVGMKTPKRLQSPVWYKDRDFPEVKTSNADIVAYIPREKELQRVIKEHNGLIEEANSLLEDAFHENETLRAENTSLNLRIKALEEEAKSNLYRLP